MHIQAKKETKLFCIIGKPGAGKHSILDYLFSNAKFIDKNDISRFICGTTKELKSSDYRDQSYEMYTLDEYQELNPKEIIESRSYDNIITENIDYYFTLEKHIKPGKNMIGLATIFQFEDIKNWAHIKQMENPSWEINIYSIYIDSPLSDRIKRLISKSKGDNDYLYDMCAKIISERFEYRSVMENKVIDKSDPKVLYIRNAGGIAQMPKIYKEVMTFIERHCNDM